MAATQKRWLTNSTSKLAKADLTVMLRKEEAWQSLPEATRIYLYSMLPTPTGEEEPHDINVHPLKSVYRAYIEEELRCWQEDLQGGKEGKKWREEAMQAGADRTQGKWDEWKLKERDSTWKKPVTSTSVQESRSDSGIGSQHESLMDES